VDGSKKGQILVPITKRQAGEYLQKEQAYTEVDEEVTECSTGKCDI
jgi:hypothetical protein